MARLISDKFSEWEKLCDERFERLKNNEEKLNRFFIDLYGIGDEITPEVEDCDVTVRRAELTREIKSLLSFAVGCIFGRYSLDREGLCYAGGQWDSSKYSTIIPCPDNIVSITDKEAGLTAQIVHFIEKVYGEETLGENLRFIALALDGSGEPRDVLYSYLQRGFFADHCKIYRGRPIYWQLSAGRKNSFRALMYIHRYEPETLSVLEKKYAQVQHEKLRSELEALSKQSPDGNKAQLRKNTERLQAQLTELEGFIERLHSLSEQSISLELDDGVKKNYEKLSDILERIK